MAEKGHIKHIESLRAIAAFMVVCFHFISFENEQGFIVSNETIRTWSSFGAQGVELFYIISGFVISYSFIRNSYRIKNYGKYFIKRLIRIMPTYLLAIIFSQLILSFLLYAAWEEPQQFNLSQFFANLTFTCDLFPDIEWYNEVYKTLKVEFQFYIVIGLIWPLLNKNLILKSIVFGSWLIAAFFTSDQQTFLLNGPYFIIGISLSQLFLKKDMLYNWIVIGTCLIMLGTLYFYEDLVISLIAIVMIQFVKFDSKITNHIGKSSYSLYLLHGSMGGWFLYWFTKDNFIHINHSIAIVIALIISILGASIAYLIIEKPFVKIGKKIQYREKGGSLNQN